MVSSGSGDSRGSGMGVVDGVSWRLLKCGVFGLLEDEGGGERWLYVEDEAEDMSRGRRADARGSGAAVAAKRGELAGRTARGLGVVAGSMVVSSRSGELPRRRRRREEDEGRGLRCCIRGRLEGGGSRLRSESCRICRDDLDRTAMVNYIWRVSGYRATNNREIKEFCRY